MNHLNIYLSICLSIHLYRYIPIGDLPPPPIYMYVYILNLEFIQNNKRLTGAKTLLKKKIKIKRLYTSGNKTYLTIIINKRCGIAEIDSQTREHNRRPRIEPHVFRYLIFGRLGMYIRRERMDLSCISSLQAKLWVHQRVHKSCCKGDKGIQF